MKSLYILRHAKASGSPDDYPDIDRPLKTSGIRDAYALGKSIKARSIRVDLIAVSSAARTMQTATIVARIAQLPFEAIRIVPELYLPNEGETLAYIRQLPDSIASVMVVGHNPDLSYLCEKFDDLLILELPTCGFVATRILVDRWSDVTIQNIEKDYVIFPQ